MNIVYVKKEPCTYGDYIDASGNRWVLNTARAVCGCVVEEWQQFADIEQAAEYWGLAPMPQPEEETEP